MTPIVIEVPMFSSPIAQTLIAIIAGLAVIRAVARFIDTLPVT